MNLTLQKYKVTGLFPLLVHSPASMVRNEGPKTKKIPTYEDEAKKGLYFDEENNFALPSMQFRSSLLNGLKNKKIGKASAISVFQAAVFNVDVFCTLIDPTTDNVLEDYEIDVRRVVIQRQGILRARPVFKKWGCYLHLQIDEDIVSPEMVEEALNVSGQIVGVGDFRIEKRGPFGKYKVELV